MAAGPLPAALRLLSGAQKLIHRQQPHQALKPQAGGEQGNPHPDAQLALWVQVPDPAGREAFWGAPLASQLLWFSARLFRVRGIQSRRAGSSVEPLRWPCDDKQSEFRSFRRQTWLWGGLWLGSSAAHSSWLLLVPGQCQPSSPFFQRRSSFLGRPCIFQIPGPHSPKNLDGTPYVGEEGRQGTSGYCRKQLLLREYSPMAAIRVCYFPSLFTNNPHSCPATSGCPAGTSPAILPTGNALPTRDHHHGQQPRDGPAWDGDDAAETLALPSQQWGWEGCPGDIPS